ncbi:MAG TPA: hypothetical protein VNC11_09880, partial [Gemmatimonadaceae bacterium]|nr:hypothetical protein [Gemmatimonadaceae bacterium]
SNMSCVRPPTTAISGPLGWLDAHRLLLLPDDARTTGVYQIYDVDAGTVSKTSLRIVSRVSVDPTGTWLLIWSDEDGQRSLHVAPSARFDLRRLVGQDPDFPEEAWFAQPINSGLYLDSIAVVRPSGPLARGVPHRFVAVAWSKGRRRMTPSAVRWSSLTPSVSTIDSLGVLLPKDTGIAVIEVSAGGWRTARDTFRIENGTDIPVLDEEWDDRAFQRWRAFGVPEPVIVKENSRGSLLINGDGNFFSGAYFRRELDASRGLAIEFELSTPITRTQGQVAIIGVNPVRSARDLSRWDHRTGYLSPFLENDAGCFFTYPTGEGPGATTRPVWFASLRAVTDASFRIDDGRSYTVRIQVFPDGRCGTAINGHPLTIYPSVGLLGRLLTPIIEGNSENTKIIVRRLTIRGGVPRDIDWAKLHFNGWIWDAISPNAEETRRTR